MAIAYPQSASRRPAEESLDELLHALNQPLTQIRCAVELMLHKPPASEMYPEKLAGVLGQAERASKLSLTMQQVLEIKREQRGQQQSTPLAPCLEAALDDFIPVAENNGVRIVRRNWTECEVAVSAKALGTALFLLLDQILSWARKDGTMEAGITRDSKAAHLLFRLVNSTEQGIACGDESQLLIIKSICGAFDAHLDMHRFDHALELQLTIPMR
ncbi:MAG: hypothetical protein DMG91_11175 [Acidobacteria bacterium]|jgi:hypothetical protein|nr:MAG: hypothetical protein DMG91_11175 [Acidobacteriota bacterium]